MRTQIHGRYMNLYVESVDPNDSCGMCGDFNANGANDVDGNIGAGGKFARHGQGTKVYDYNQLTTCQKVGEAGCTVGSNSGRTSACDIWKYVPKDDDKGGKEGKVPVS